MPIAGEVRPSPLTDAQLAQRIASSPAGAAQIEEAELYRRFVARVRLYGLRHLRDEAAAQDLAQEVLLVAIERLRAGEIRNPEQIGSFILGTSRFMAGSVRRTAQRHQRLAEQFAVATTANQSSIAALDSTRVGRCLETLGERERAILILTFYAEKTAAEIAQTLGSTAGGIRVSRYRALQRLRECIGLRRPA